MREQETDHDATLPSDHSSPRHGHLAHTALGGVGAARAEPGQTPSRARPAVGASDGDNAVVMGDSFGSGEGADENQFIPPSSVWKREWNGTKGCHKSWSAWGLGVAQAYADQGRITQVKLWSCSWARISPRMLPRTRSLTTDDVLA